MQEAAFRRVMERYRDMVFRIAYTYMRNAPDADDVTQDVFVKLLRSDTAFENERHLRRWLVRVTVNACRSLFRTPWRRVEDIEDYAHQLAMPSKEHEDLFAAVMRLPERYRVPMVLFYYGGFSTDEIAGLVHARPATVRARLSRARARLRAQLGDDGHVE